MIRCCFTLVRHCSFDTGAHEIAFHGFDDPEIPFDILIGGAATVYVKQDIETAIKGAIIDSDITVHIASPDEKFGGDSLQNIVNRLTAGGANGIQIEQKSREGDAPRPSVE